jgi:hypothetical protein
MASSLNPLNSLIIIVTRVVQSNPDYWTNFSKLESYLCWITEATSFTILALSFTKQNGFSVINTFFLKNSSSTFINLSHVKNSGSFLSRVSRFLVMCSYSNTPEGLSGQKQKFIASTTKQNVVTYSIEKFFGSFICQSLHLS